MGTRRKHSKLSSAFVVLQKWARKAVYKSGAELQFRGTLSKHVLRSSFTCSFLVLLRNDLHFYVWIFHTLDPRPSSSPISSPRPQLRSTLYQIYSSLSFLNSTLLKRSKQSVAEPENYIRSEFSLEILKVYMFFRGWNSRYLRPMNLYCRKWYFIEDVSNTMLKKKKNIRVDTKKSIKIRRKKFFPQNCGMFNFDYRFFSYT